MVRECDLGGLVLPGRQCGCVGGAGGKVSEGSPGTPSSLRPFEIPAAGPPQLCCGLWLFIPM